MYSTKYAVGIHILSLIALKQEDGITSDYIAGSVNTNPALVRRLMSDLKKSGLIQTKTKVGVTGLMKPPEEITLLEIFKAVENRQDLFAIHSDTNSDCPVGARIGCVLERINHKVQSSFEEELETMHLSDILEGLGNI
ncbi:Rrf2 family transcriptional regulator [Anaerocolumna sp. AGMB13020]|uniref:Rrf2 family transcriptional regulator n=1 Tax=Anaerocolumna sp. AGMB13020 TaxID=3081750 RepID=UPI002953B94D|nr:Rrf2 family transcriptional regulator [Anaerocolumna sp. AGMB13020]WOO35893.1 Rrf2 family transcriptional regulator [Anaerocolumna sp. AGMB13020]